MGGGGGGGERGRAKIMPLMKLKTKQATVVVERRPFSQRVGRGMREREGRKWKLGGRRLKL